MSMSARPRRARVSAVLLALLPILAPTSALVAADLSAGYEFKPVKLGGGGFVSGLQIHPAKGGPAYCRTDVGGLYRWDEDSATWTQLMVAPALPPEVIAAEATNTGDGLPGDGYRRTGLYHVESIAIDPNDPAVLFVAAGSVLDQPGTLLKSRDGGVTFQATRLAVPMSGNAPYEARVHGERLAVHPADSRLVLFGSRTQGLWRSVNGGLDWARVDAVPAGQPIKKLSVGVGPVVFDPASPGRAYLSVATVGTFRSDDAGATWKQIGSEWADDLVVSQGAVYLCRAGLGVQRYLPASGWLAVNPAGDKQVNNLAVDPANPKRVFAMHAGGKNLYRSLDGGVSWTKLVSSSNTAEGRELFRSRDIPWVENTNVRTWLSVGELAVDPRDPARLWFAEGMGIWRSTDATDDHNAPSFDNISSGIEELVASDVLATPGGKVTFLAWDRVGFHRTHATLDQAPDAQIGLSQTFGMGISLATSGQHPDFVVASVADIRKPPLSGGYDGFGVTSGTSSDGGATWRIFDSVDQATEANTPETLMFGEIVVSATDTNNLVWLPRWPGWFIRDGKVVPDGNGKDQFIYSSVDGGASWQAASIGDYEDYRREYMTVKRSLVADPVVGGKFYAYDRKGRIFVSTDNGANWTATYSGGTLPVHAYSNVFRAAPGRAGHLWFASGRDYRGGRDSEGVFRSTDSGDTWLKLDGFSTAWHIGFGRAERDGGYPAIYVYGKYNGAWGLYRSTDEARGWDLLAAYPLGLLDHITALNGDPDLFGRVYLGFSGNGFAYGTPRGYVAPPKPSPAANKPKPALSTPPVRPTPIPAAAKPAPAPTMPVAAAASPARAAGAATPPRFDFETDAQGWSNAWGSPGIVSVSSSDDRAFTGSRSLRIVISGTLAVRPILNVLIERPAGLTAGSTVRFAYWLPAGAGVTNISPIASGSEVKWIDNHTEPATDRWAEIELPIPPDAGVISYIGFQIRIKPDFHGSIYLDSVSY